MTIEITQSSLSSRSPSLAVLIDDFERRSVAEHPLFLHLRAGTPSPPKLWLLVANLDVGVARFTHWLAQTIASSSHIATRSILAHQLDDELGGGDPSKVHRVLFERFFRSLDPWKPRDEAAHLSPGEELRTVSEALFDGTQPWEAIGALMVLEVMAKQFDGALAQEIRRCGTQIDRHAAHWAFLHEELEKEHADDSHDLVGHLPDDPGVREAIASGAELIRLAAYRFLDGVLRLCAQSSAA